MSNLTTHRIADRTVEIPLTATTTMKEIKLTAFDRKRIKPTGAWPIWLVLRKIMPKKEAADLYEQIRRQTQEQ
jgi:hypothetical protein